MANLKANKLSDKQLQKLVRPDVKTWIRDGNGLALCTTPTDKMNWRQWYFVFASPETGKRRYYPLGTYPGVSLADARTEATKLLAEVKKAIDPLERERREREARLAADELKRQADEAAAKVATVADLCKDYIEKHAMKFKRSWREDKRILDREVVPFWGDRKAQDIKKRDVTTLLEKIVDRGAPSMGNSTFRVIRKMFNFAVERDILEYSPCLGAKELSPNPTRDRTLDEKEIKTLWQTIDSAAMSTGTKLAIKLILVTAQRPGEVAGLHTDEIDGNIWTIPKERAKNGKEHRVYLTALAQGIIEQAVAHAKFMREMKPEEKYSGFVFPCREYKKIQPIQVTAMAKAIRRSMEWPLTDIKGKPLYKKDGTPATENKLQVAQFTPHDLRRTAASFMASLDFMDEIIDAVLNHVKKGIIATYNRHGYDNQKQQALEAWSRKLDNIISGSESAKVIQITRKAA